MEKAGNHVRIALEPGYASAVTELVPAATVQRHVRFVMVRENVEFVAELKRVFALGVTVAGKRKNLATLAE